MHGALIKQEISLITRKMDWLFLRAPHLEVADAFKISRSSRSRVMSRFDIPVAALEFSVNSIEIKRGYLVRCNASCGVFYENGGFHAGCRSQNKL